MYQPDDTLFGSDLWEVALERYAQAIHLTVTLFNADLGVVFGPVHPTPLFQLFDASGYDPGIIAECAQRCLAQAEQRPAVIIAEAGALAVIGTSLVLQEKVVAAAVAGYAFVDFSQLSEIQSMARKSGIAFERIWRVAREQKPVPQRQLIVHGELLQVLGDALLRENYRTRQYEQIAANLERIVEERTSAVRDLTVNLLRAQDDQNSRIGRELHDSIGGYLCHASMILATYREGRDTPDKHKGALAEVAASLDKCLTETRTISYLLRPPLLDELGLVSAAKELVEGVRRRSGVQVKLKIPRKLKRLPGVLEVVLFRILQESLTNALRHSESQSVDVQLGVARNHVELAVRDYGKGIPPELLDKFRATGRGGGIGLNSIRERTNQLNGRFEIESNGQGTLVRVIFPLPAAGPQASRVRQGTASAQARNARH